MRTWMGDSSLLGCELAAALSVLSAAVLMTSVSAESKVFGGGGDRDPKEGVPPWGEDGSS